jgi:beta-glucanase (GH16 family)
VWIVLPISDHGDNVPCRSIAESGRDFADDFHVFGLEWTADYLNFTVDGKLIGSTGVPPGGFWSLGGLDKIEGAQNIWKDGKPMAPFDKKVIKGNLLAYETLQ